jgi:hypothetical protein
LDLSRFDSRKLAHSQQIKNLICIFIQILKFKLAGALSFLL